MKIYFRDKNKKAEQYRKENKTPGVFYGPNLKATPIYVLEKDINQLYREHEGGIFEFELEDGTKLQGLFREVQFHPLNDKIIHFDIYVPSLEKEIRTKIPLEFIGEAPVLKKGGVLNFALSELEVEALPQNLPEKILVDLSSLTEIDQSIYVKDLNLPKNIKVLIDEKQVVVTALPETLGEEAKEETTNV